MQKILTLIITAAILYMLFQHSISSLKLPGSLNITQSNEELPKANNGSVLQPELSGNFIERTISSVLLNVLKTEEGRGFLESLIQPENRALAGSEMSFEMNSSNFINSLFKISTTGKGDIGPASCGHIVTIDYKLLNAQNQVVEENTTTWPLGTNKIAPGLDAVVVGMKTGQIRYATVSSKYFTETATDKISHYKVQLLLKHIVPNNFIDNTVKIFDDQLAYKVPILCGSRVKCDTRITKISNGQVIYDTVTLGKKIDMHVGNMSYPIIFSHALHNKIPIGTRTVITKGAWLQSYASKYSTIFPTTILPKEEYFMVEFFNFDNMVTNTVMPEHML